MSSLLVHFWLFQALYWLTYFHSFHLIARPSSPGLSLESTLSFDESGADKRTLLSSMVSIKPVFPNARICFKIPDFSIKKKHHFQPLRHLDSFLKRQKQSAISFTFSNLKNHHPQTTNLRYLSPQIFEITSDIPGSVFRFRILATAPSEGFNEEFVLENFYPLPLEHCPTEAVPEPPALTTKTVITMSHPRSISLYGPAGTSEETLTKASINSSRLVLFGSTKRNVETFLVDDLPVTLVSPDLKGREFKRTISSIIKSHTDLFGPFPWTHLVILERDQAWDANTPGMIAFHKPKQPLFRYLQQDVLNWQYWVLSSLIGAQWSGSSLQTEPKDDWLTAGICDFASAHWLENQKERDNLFNFFDHEISWIQFNFRQIQDMTASMLNQEYPGSQLTDTEFKTISSKENQHPLLFIKNSVAMRSVSSVLGKKHTQKFLQLFFKKHRYQKFDPKGFYSALLTYTRKNKLSASGADTLREWWTQTGWPEYGITSFIREKLPGGRWLTETTIRSNSNLNPPFKLRIRDKDGHSWYLFPQKSGDINQNRRWTAGLITDLEPASAEIDPQHHLFDKDRFNNSTGSFGLDFFPFGTNTLSDSRYTSVWIPYMFRRPGEHTSVALQLAFLRYLQSGFYIRAETSPSDRKTGIHIKYQHFSDLLESKVTTSLTQDYQNTRTIEALTEFPSRAIFTGLNASPLLSGRFRQYPGQSHLNHPSLMGGLKVSFPDLGPCKFYMEAGAELAKGLSGRSQSYRRYLGSYRNICTIGRSVAYDLRLFKGYLDQRSDIVPESVYFKWNHLKEAGMRIDLPLPKENSKVNSVNQEITLPFMAPKMLDILHLSQKLTFKIFHDMGFYQAQGTPDLEASGLGVQMPIGGDIMGMGSLTLSRFSILTILYTRNQKETSRKPKLLFDISGEF